MEGEKFISTALANLKFSLNLPECVSDSDLVIEAVVENLDLKRKLFSIIDFVC